MHQRIPLFMHPRTASAAALAVAGIAVAIGLAIPHYIPLRFVEEGGVIETITLWAYLVAVLGINLMLREQMSRLDVLAASVVLAAMGAREADLHTAIYGVSILKSRFYLEAPLRHVMGALAILVPIALAICWLLFRHGRAWLRPYTRWSVPASTFALMVGIMVMTKLFDRAPAALGLAGLVPTVVLHVLLSLEELLELFLPAFAVLVFAQCRLGMAAQPLVISDIDRNPDRGHT